MPLLRRELAELTHTTATDTKSSCNIARVDNSVSHRDYEKSEKYNCHGNADYA